MHRTHLSLAILAASTGKSVSALSERCSISQSTLSKLINSDRRIDVDTLHALYTRLDHGAGTQILLGHLHDEITRAGASILDWTVEPRGGVDAGDLATLEAAIGGPSKLPESVAAEMRGMLNHLANIVRHYRATTHAQVEPLQMVAEDQESYGITAAEHDQHFRASVLGALEEVEKETSASDQSTARSAEPAPPPAEPVLKAGRRKK